MPRSRRKRDPVLAEVDAINEKIATLESQIKDENAALWQAELACYLIKGDKSKRQKRESSQKATLTKTTILLTSKNHFWVMS